MGDVYCARCGEPFEAYHLRHDAIYETDLLESTKKHMSNRATPISEPGVREALKRAGYEFSGNSVLCLSRCPCCKANAEHNGKPDKQVVRDRMEKQSILSELLGDDEDGIQSMLEDMGEDF
jgi:hypothetical protein